MTFIYSLKPALINTTLTIRKTNTNTIPRKNKGSFSHLLLNQFLGASCTFAYFARSYALTAKLFTCLDFYLLKVSFYAFLKAKPF